MKNSLSCGQNGSMSSPKLLPAAIVASKITQKSTFIFLHGLGDTEAGWCSALRNLIPDDCKLICPRAKTMPVSLNMDIPMPAWYNIFSLTVDAKQDEAGIIAASEELGKFVEAEVNNGIPSDKIVIGGFSQGGSVAIYHALTTDRHFGGVVGLSCWLPLHNKFMTDPGIIIGCRETPIFQGHGSNDSVVPFMMGQKTHELLKGFNFGKSEFKVYQHMGHCSSGEEMGDLASFVKKALQAA